MLSQIKVYISALVAAVVGVLAWLVNYQSKRAENAEERAETAEAKAEAATKNVEVQQKLNQVKVESGKRKNKSEETIQKIKGSGTRPDVFSDSSMLDN